MHDRWRIRGARAGKILSHGANGCIAVCAVVWVALVGFMVVSERVDAGSLCVGTASGIASSGVLLGVVQWINRSRVK